MRARRRVRVRARLERGQPVSASGQQSADPGVGQCRDLRLCWSTALGEGPLDVVEHGRVGHAVESEPGDLVEGRAVLGERGRSTGHRHHESAVVRTPPTGGFCRRGHQLSLDAFDAVRQGYITEERRPGRLGRPGRPGHVRLHPVLAHGPRLAAASGARAANFSRSRERTRHTPGGCGAGRRVRSWVRGRGRSHARRPGNGVLIRQFPGAAWGRPMPWGRSMPRCGRRRRRWWRR